jgi:hypothetical protein
MLATLRFWRVFTLRLQALSGGQILSVFPDSFIVAGPVCCERSIELRIITVLFENQSVFKIAFIIIIIINRLLK